MERIGYSRKIEDPAFKKYLKNTNRWAGMFGVVLALIAFVGFYIAGELGIDGVENPQGMMIGAGVGGMFLLITLYSIVSRKKSRTWDGVVIDKKVKNKTRRDDDDHVTHYTVYEVIIKEDNGKKHEIRVENDDTVFNYYNVGDRIRHHAGLNSYEKYDKTGDTIIFCAACGDINNIEDQTCHRCKCPLLN